MLASAAEEEAVEAACWPDRGYGGDEIAWGVIYMQRGSEAAGSAGRGGEEEPWKRRSLAGNHLAFLR